MSIFTCGASWSWSSSQNRHSGRAESIYPRDRLYNGLEESCDVGDDDPALPVCLSGIDPSQEWSKRRLNQRLRRKHNTSNQLVGVRFCWVAVGAGHITLPKVQWVDSRAYLLYHRTECAVPSLPIFTLLFLQLYNASCFLPCAFRVFHPDSLRGVRWYDTAVRETTEKKERKETQCGRKTHLVAMFRYRKKNIRKESNMGKQYEGLAEHMLASEIFGDLEKAYIKAQLLIKYWFRHVRGMPRRSLNQFPAIVCNMLR